MPDYRIDNPYQRLLANATQNYNVTVFFPVGYRRVFPVWRAIKDQPESIDVVHIHWLESFIKGQSLITRLLYSVKFLLDILLTRLSGVKVVWTIHDYLEHDAPHPELELWLRKVLVHLSNKLIIHNQSFLETIASEYGFPEKKAVVIPHGHYRNVYGSSIDKSIARQKLNLPTDKLVYLYLGMIRPYKGIEDLLDVWEKHKFDNSLLLIAGNPIIPEYGKFIKDKIDTLNDVLLYDFFIKNEDIHLFFSAADIVVLPFKKVLTSGSAILAMSFGKPIIAPKMGSLPDLLSDAKTLLYDSQDKTGLATALLNSHHLNLEELSKIIIKACDDLDWDKIGYKTSEVYHNC